MLPAYSGLSLVNLMQALISSKEVGFSKLHVRPTTDTSGVGKRTAMPGPP